MKSLSLLTLSALLISTTLHAATPDYIVAAVGDASRPERDVARDVNRKPAEVLSFAGVKPGDRVGELIPGRGYFTHLFCKIVGEQGHVYTVSVMRAVQTGAPPADMASSSSAPAAETTKGTPCNNVTADSMLATEFKLPDKLDLVWTSENYHDLYNPMFGKPDMLAFNKTIFAALKPGSVYMVEDHAAQTGSGGRDTQTLHRIDPEQVKKDVLAAGFVFEGSSEALNNPDDPLTEKVFGLQGKSSKFLFKFRKPAK